VYSEELPNLAGMQGLQYNERLKQLDLMRLVKRTVRSDLIETFVIMNGEYDLIRDLFFQLEEGIEEDMIRNCSREDSDLILESMLFVTKLSTTRTHYPQVALIVIPLTLLRSISRMNWNRELYKKYS